jgi:hypothetical protein
LEQEVLSLVSTEGFNLVKPDDRAALAQVFLNNKQASNSIVHRFGGGVYIREATYPKNVMIMGSEHLTEHMNVLLKGSINVMDDLGNTQTLVAPYMFVAAAGSKTGYTLEEVVWQNIYVTSSTDVAYLESILFKSPEMFHEHQQKKLEQEYPLHEDDREDFIHAITEGGWTIETVEAISKYRGDCIPFPDGNYSFSTGPSPIQGTGLFATADIVEGQVIAPMNIRGKRTPAGYLTNHSKTPNACMVRSGDNLLLVATRSIHGMVGGDFGEEITLDYRQGMKLNNLWKGNIPCQLASQ